MDIKLIKSGGLVGRKMTAQTAWTFNKQDWQELVHAIRRQEGAGASRDAFSYAIQAGDDEGSRVPISIQSIPPRFEELFKKLFDTMKVEK